MDPIKIFTMEDQGMDYLSQRVKSDLITTEKLTFAMTGSAVVIASG